MISVINEAGSKVCQNLFEYSNRWKQPINVSKTVVQIFDSSVIRPTVEIKMNNHILETTKTFKYLGFTWTDKMSIKPIVDKCLQNIQKSYTKLKWLQTNRSVTTQVLKTCYFAQSLPFFTWIFSFFSLLPTTLRETICSKYRVGISIIHRCQFIVAKDIFKCSKEAPLESYVVKYLQKRLSKAHITDLGLSHFYHDILYWDHLTSNYNAKNLGIGHLIRLTRIKKLKQRKESNLVRWIDFIDKQKMSLQCTWRKRKRGNEYSILHSSVINHLSPVTIPFFILSVTSFHYPLRPNSTYHSSIAPIPSPSHSEPTEKIILLKCNKCI